MRIVVSRRDLNQMRVGKWANIVDCRARKKAKGADFRAFAVPN
jgi:hypothetical protein